MKNKNLISLVLVLFFILSCTSKTSNSSPMSSSPKAQKINIERIKVAQDLIKKNGKSPMVKKILDYQKFYYSGLHKELNNLLITTSNNLKNRNLTTARKLAIKNMLRDADLMDEVKKYAIGIKDIDNDNSYIRFSHTKTPFILRKAAEFLADDNYFNAIILGTYPNKFDWNKPTFLGGNPNYDDKGTVAISALTASLIYLLDDKEMVKNLYNHSSIIYNESVTEVLSGNPKLLKRIRKNYHLFSAENNVVSKVYEAYEFGGNKDLKVVNNPKYVPFDCSTGISMLLSLKENSFFTGHLASRYNEVFEENSVYWRDTDWKIRSEIIKNLEPIKLKDLSKIKAGTIIVLRSLVSEKSLKDPKDFVGSGGHIAVVLGVNGDDLYSISWARSLEDENKSGLGIDVTSISKTKKAVSDKKLILFGYKLRK